MADELSGIEQSLRDIAGREGTVSADRVSQFQIDELKAADLKEGEDEDLERQRAPPLPAST
jgi:DNA repair ATPase RecN